MLAPRKSLSGCWTCLLRRKKCDKVRPECGVCKSLDIDCHYNSRKPEWMIRGDKQRKMMGNIKDQIKQNAASRRERHRASLDSSMNGEHGRGISVISFESDIVGNDSSPRCMDSDRVLDNKSFQKNTISMEFISEHPPVKQSSEFIHEETLKFKHETQPGSHVFPIDDGISSILFSQNPDYETDFIMKYLDYVFPSLFPFYRPSIFETGRSWLLSLLRHSRIAFHSALSLTSYFFTIALTDAYGDAYADCTTDIWNRLENHADRCFEIINMNMLDLNLRDKTTTVLQKVQTMESIVQILMFEVVLGRSADWNLHLTPALALFDEVISVADTHNSKMISALHSIGRPSWYKAEYSHYIWNPDQAGFRFFAAILVFIDIIASTALAQSPRLTAYHIDILAKQDDGAPVLGFTHLRLSTVVGCQNSVIVAIGQIAKLDVWKKSMNRSERLSKFELAKRSTPISASLVSTLDALDSNVALLQPYDPLNLPFQSYAVRSVAAGPSAATTRIWAHAAQIYLTVVVCGWQPSNTQIRDSVLRILELLHDLPSNHLRTLAWPLCVAGCLASVDQEKFFRNMFGTKKKLELIGSLNEAQRVMEKVWKSKAMANTETWDLATCFNILEKPVLLV